MIVLDSQVALDGLIDRIADAVVERLQGGGIGEGRKLAVREYEAGELLGLPSHRIKSARLRGELRAVKCGRSYLYAVDELRRFLSTNET